MDQIPNTLGTAAFSEEATDWQKRLEKFMPMAFRARAKVLDILQLDASKVMEDIERATVPSPTMEILRDCADVILFVHADAITIYENDCIGIGGVNFGKIWQYRDLTPHQILVLQSLSLFESLKNPPYQNSKEFLTEMAPFLKEEYEKEDENNASDWLKKKVRFEAILSELESMNISENGTVTPGYLQEMK